MIDEPQWVVTKSTATFSRVCAPMDDSEIEARAVRAVELFLRLYQAPGANH